MKDRGKMLIAIGGEEGCQKLAQTFYRRVANSSILKPLFPGKSLRCATEELAAFLIQFLDGDEQKTQYRWWLSLRESHARFAISEDQRREWLALMEVALRSCQFQSETQEALLQWFEVGSKYVVGRGGGTVAEPELADCWNRTLSLDRLVEAICNGDDRAVLSTFENFSARPSLFVGVLARMLRTRRPELMGAVGDALRKNPTLGGVKSGGRTLLHYAAAYGNVEIVSQLLTLGVDPNILDNTNHTPLYRLANECRFESGPEIDRLLVAAGADLNANKGATRATALHMAARRGFLEIAQELVRLGASPNISDTKGDTPFDRARKCRKPEIVEFLGRL